MDCFGYLELNQCMINEAQIDLEILYADIDMVRRNKIAKYQIWSDASTSVGGGSYLCDAKKPSDVLLEVSRVRWTQHELQIFNALKFQSMSWTLV